MKISSFTNLSFIESAKGLITLRTGGSAEKDFVVVDGSGEPFFQSHSYDESHEALLARYNSDNGHPVEVPFNYNIDPFRGNCPILLSDVTIPSGTNLLDDGVQFIQVGYNGQPAFVKYRRREDGEKVELASAEYLNELFE